MAERRTPVFGFYDFQFIFPNSPNGQMAQQLNVAQLNAYYKALIHKIRQIDILVEIDALLAASQEVKSSLVGTTSSFSTHGG